MNWLDFMEIFLPGILRLTQIKSMNQIYLFIS